MALELLETGASAVKDTDVELKKILLITRYSDQISQPSSGASSLHVASRTIQSNKDASV